MSFAEGTKLGPYEIIALLGTGGMGEVYRARDPRLSRDVAIKVLAPAFSSDQDRLRRFEQEARAAGLLNHPNILAIYDVGMEGEYPYLVTELLQGETLRSKLQNGALAPRKAIEIAAQIAHGVAAAHEKGIIHRDLKPENLFLMKDGRIKILDFGLAKLIQADENGEKSELLTIDPQTGSGIILGTVGYMSPEQVRGLPADKRSDIFSLGSILYEMVSGQRAFKGKSSVEVLNAILKEEPTELLQLNENFPPALQRLVRSCLEKHPEDRFQSIRDLAIAFEALSDSSGSIQRIDIQERTVGMTELQFQRLTYRHGYIWSARFAPDGSTIVYGASWNGEACKLFLTRAEASESLPLSLPDADILSISTKGEMAVSLGRHFDVGYTSSGTLAHLPITGGAPREVLEDVQDADWAPDGEELVLVRRSGGQYSLEFPTGNVICQANSWISNARMSRDGKLIAFVDHPVYGDDSGSIRIIDLSGRTIVLTESWSSVQGLAWSTDRTEVWFSAAKQTADRTLYAVSLTGKVRSVLRVPVPLELYDISSTGRVLVSRVNHHRRISGLSLNDTREHDLSWLNWSLPCALSPDGKNLLFMEQGGPLVINRVSIRKIDEFSPVPIGPGQVLDISPDWKWALSLLETRQLVMLPVGIGKQKNVNIGNLDCDWAAWFPDGGKILFFASEKGHLSRLFTLDLAGGNPIAVTEEGANHFDQFMTSRISPDGKFVAGWDPDRNLTIFSLDGGKHQRVPETPTGFVGIHWSEDGTSLYTVHPSGIPAKIYCANLKTGRRELWKEIQPSDPAGIHGLSPIVMTPDLSYLVYSYRRVLSDLYVVDGLK